MNIDASIFIRAKNEAALIGQCIERIQSQAGSLRSEIVLLDSGSSDQTAQIASSLGARVYSIPAEKFSYAGTLNAGIELCNGEYFIPLSAHAVPVNERWLISLIDACSTAKRIASYSRQIAWPDASALEKERLGLDFPLKAHTTNLATLENCKNDWRNFYRSLQFSNASSCIRRSILKQILFRDLPFSEDRAFALDCILSGFEIEYAPDSIVYHSHYPELSDFYQVARRATFAEQALKSLAEKNMNCKFESDKYPYWKLLAILPFACLKSMPALLASIFASPEKKACLYREVAFLLASIGTSFGKYRGLKEYRSAGEAFELAPKNPSALLELIHEY